MGVAWQLHGSCMAVAWQLHGSCMAVAWQLHAPSDRLPFICIHLSGEKHGEKNCLTQEHNTMTLLLELGQINPEHNSLTIAGERHIP